MFNNIPISYRNELFSEVTKRHTETEVIFLTERESVRNTVDLSDLESVNCTVLKPMLQWRNKSTTTSDKIVAAPPLRKLLQFNVIVFFSYSYLIYLISALFARALGKQTVAFCETTLPDSQGSPGRQRIKGWILSVAFGRFIVPGASSEAFLLWLGISKHKIDRIGNGIRMSPAAKAISGASKRANTPTKLGLVGRLSPEKSFESFLDLVHNEPDYEVTVAGDGPLRERLQNKFTGGNITFTGFLRKDALEKLYLDIDILILPSEREPWGFVAIEAISYGKALVLSDHVGCAAELCPTAGETFEWSNFESCRSALRKVVNDYAKYSDGALKLREQYTVQAQADALLKALKLS